MIDWPRLLADSAVLIGIATAYLLVVAMRNPRLFLQDFPPAVRAAVPPRTRAETREAAIIGLPFMLALLGYPFVAVHRLGAVSFTGRFVHALGISMAFNTWDLLVLDWLVVCAITPRLFVIPGTEGNPGYKDYAFHFRGFLIGTGLSIAWSLVVALAATFVRA